MCEIRSRLTHVKYNNSVNECKTQVTVHNLYIPTKFKYLNGQ